MTEQEIKEIKRRAGILTEGYVHRQAMAALETISNAMVALDDELYGIGGSASGNLRDKLLRLSKEASQRIGEIKQLLVRIPG